MTSVLDASVAAKWFLPPRDEDLVDKALELFRAYDSGRIDLIVPDIFWAEIGNIAWKSIRRKRWAPSEAAAAMQAARLLRFPTASSKSLLGMAFTICSESVVSLYDALYVALAERESANLITADERLVNTLSGRFPVRWLGAFSIS